MEYPLLLYRGENFNANFTYFSGMDTDHSFLVVWKGRKTLLVPGLNYAIAKAKFKGNVLVYENPFESLSKLLKGKKVHADFSSLSTKAYLRIAKFCKLKDCSVQLLEIRSRKSKSEVGKLRAAAKTTKELIQSLMISPGMREMDLRTQLMANMVELGLSPSFEPIVSSGGNTAFPHSSSTKSRVKDFVLVDCGVRYDGYCGDITRCIFLKKKTKAESLYLELKEITSAIIDAIPEMQNGRDVALFAESEIKRHNFPKLIHSIGHGVGLDIHEFPRLSKKFDDEIKGRVFTIEPGIYLKSFGLRFEEMVYFDGKKARIL